MTKAQRTRQLIIEKTAPIFNVKGYSGTSINDMTAATGLTKGSIYGNFSNKDDVALAAFDHNLAKIQRLVALEMEKLGSFREKLLVYVKVYGNFVHLPFSDGGCPILNTAIESDDTHPDLKQKAFDAVRSWKDTITSLIIKGIGNNEFKASVNPEQSALTIIALIEGGMMIFKLTGKTNYRTLIMESVEKLINDLEG